MDGDFSLLGPIDLLQMLSQARQTGVFQVPGGKVFIDEGNPIHAEYRGRSGPDGLYQILALKEGQFRFLKGEVATKETLVGTLDNYLLQALRYLDSRVEIGPFDQLMVADSQRTHSLTLSPDEHKLIMMLSKPISVIDLMGQTGMTLEAIVTLVGHIARLGLVRVIHRTPHTVRMRVEMLLQEGISRIDAMLHKAWKRQFGSFDAVEVSVDGRNLRIPVEPASGLGAQLLVSPEGLMFYNLHVGSEVLVWPAI
ncbi:DUF4388 domain-containing protein [Calidithermus roseus]|uniref:PatA-like N-terminal domain-containing protein n=1 Tax=Calidithermus roseus TaxID=1644118 RepID=A0A399EXB7_9DEIN|nr:DUF4388 domain-containing protein [Calidithermus roseus]RIH88658.1 hypothetical protein Mrose_00691 [Calidithermus roseus]